MYKENAHLYLPLIQALADGELQAKTISGEWVDIDMTNFLAEPDNYRRKPKPKMSWYRVAEFESVDGGYMPCIANGYLDNENVVLELPNFVRWITDRIPYEVTVA